ncbi:tetratricopeptide repeat protein [Flavivirga rizhaonensis]|uniref:Tetratricopeptide repeat protein n=1 Tax=Flavivirga rizhaonensis TaxID=2559571 RepID=A0A4S1DUJ5_9FLAO|nr:tetratricopeptide repeat protein [Flavivirga rizhaonensis]TGV01740.1 tetratricopeptide repeat protein [Flavivirga rizhaonensis]
MKRIALILLTCIVSISFAQQEDKEQVLALKKANGFVYEGNSLIKDDFVSGEMAYRQAISKQPNTVAGIYNLGNAYYKEGNLEEALYRHEQAAKATNSKSEKHKAYHNIGNILMQNKKCKEAVEAFKNALRNDPTDNETRYNLGIAKICAEEQKKQEDENKDDENKEDENKDDKDKKDNEDKKDKEGDDKEDKKDKGDEEKKEGDDEKDDKGNPKEDKGKGDEDKKKEQQKPKPQPGQMSPQQIKNLLEAMNNQEQKVQEKMNAVKEKGAKIKTEKDW